MLHVLLHGTLEAQELDIRAVVLDAALLAQTDVLIPTQRRETPVLADDDLLAARELVLRAAQRLDGVGAVRVTRPDGKQDLANVDTCDEAVGLAEGAAHTSLETIGSRARQHLVDPHDVVRVGAHA